ncbi:MAG: hypothetical protein KC621_11755 [Myxococcales bacterium]|nr:hypothetical protein [Myxococcales bacterium]
MSAPIEWRAAAGAELETDSHGILDLGVRSGDWSAQLFTDTLDLRWEHAYGRGKVSVGLRGAGFAAGMFISPYTAGAPDRDRAQLVQYVGPDVLAQRWLGHGWYAGGEGFARAHHFTPMGDATLVVPDTVWLRGDAVIGGWFADGARSVRASMGVDVSTVDGRISPHAAGEARARLEAEVAPFGELRAAWAEDADDLLATRLGGMTPYHVPVAGLAWAEVWAQDLVAARLGAQWTHGGLEVPVFVDGAAWILPEDRSSPDPDAAATVGFGGGLGYRSGTWSARTTVGVAPFWERPEGTWPVSVFFLLGTDWRRAQGSHSSTTPEG